MSQPTPADDPEVATFAVQVLRTALRRLAARLLLSETEPAVTQYRFVERLMRIAITLAGAGTARHPYVQIHEAAPGGEETLLPKLTGIDLPDLLAVRAGDQFAAALAGDEAAGQAVEAIAEQILLTEDIQLN